jgi:hypothetical protein
VWDGVGWGEVKDAEELRKWEGVGRGARCHGCRPHMQQTQSEWAWGGGEPLLPRKQGMGRSA